MRIATWNVNSVVARLPRLVEWLEQAAPDVVCLQETKVAQGAFPADEVTALGYEIAQNGEGRWNGVAILSRAGLADVAPGLPGDPGWPDETTLEARTIAATCGPVRLRSVYVPNGRTPDAPHFAYKLRWLAALRETVVRLREEHLRSTNQVRDRLRQFAISRERVAARRQLMARQALSRRAPS